MEKIGVDVHKVGSQVGIRTDDGTFVEQRIPTTREAFAKYLGDAPGPASCSRRRPRASGWRDVSKRSGTR